MIAGLKTKGGGGDSKGKDGAPEKLITECGGDGKNGQDTSGSPPEQKDDSSLDRKAPNL
jgi:hypothetical protein